MTYKQLTKKFGKKQVGIWIREREKKFNFINKSKKVRQLQKVKTYIEAEREWLKNMLWIEDQIKK